MQVALITGASGGLGERLAISLDRKGYRIIAHYFTSEEKAKKLSKLLNNTIYILKADIRSFEDVRRMALAVDRDVGRLNVLINNAGITKDLPLMKYPLSDWNDIMATNLKGVYNTIRHFVPLMIKSGGGHIINISSYAGIRGKEGQVAYSTSKSALLGLTYTLAKEFSSLNIKVNTVIPGYLPFGMGINTQKAMDGAKDSSVLGMLSVPGDVTKFISYLVETTGITGQVFSLESRI